MDELRLSRLAPGSIPKGIYLLLGAIFGLFLLCKNSRSPPSSASKPKLHPGPIPHIFLLQAYGQAGGNTDSDPSISCPSSSFQVGLLREFPMERMARRREPDVEEPNKRSKAVGSEYGLAPGLAFSALERYIFRGNLPLTLKHRKPDNETTEIASLHNPMPYPKPDGVLSFDVPTSLHRSNTTKAELAKKCIIVGAPSGLFSALNPSIIKHVRNSKQVNSIIEAMLQSEKVEKQELQHKPLEQSRSGSRGAKQRNTLVSDQLDLSLNEAFIPACFGSRMQSSESDIPDYKFNNDSRNTSIHKSEMMLSY